MFPRVILITLLLAASATQASAAVSYALSGIGTDEAGHQIQQSFTYFAPAAITERTGLSAAELAFDVNAQFVVFDPDLKPHSGYRETSDAILVQVGGDAFGYYFPVGTFGELGKFTAAATPSSTGSLTIATDDGVRFDVPEPASLTLLAGGLASLIWGRSVASRRGSRIMNGPGCIRPESVPLRRRDR